MLSNEEKEEMLAVSQSQKLQQEMKALSQRKQSPLIGENGITDLDLYVKFLTEYNVMFNHDLKPRRTMSEKNICL